MDVPDLVRDALGGEDVEAGVNLGDDDVLCLTPTRTILYRAEGLLSDESIEEFSHDIDRLHVQDGRRKTTFELEYVDGTRTFDVPSGRDEPVLEILLEGILHESGVAAPEETVSGAFRFSELTLVVTDARVVKHIGAVVWSEDFEVYPFDDLTRLGFEEGSVATELVLEMNGRPQRIKTPTDRAREVRQVVERATFSYFDVSSIDQLNAAIGKQGTPAEDSTATGGDASDIQLGEGIDPLVTEDADPDPEQTDLEAPAAGESAVDSTTENQPASDPLPGTEADDHDSREPVPAADDARDDRGDSTPVQPDEGRSETPADDRSVPATEPDDAASEPPADHAEREPAADGRNAPEHADDATEPPDAHDSGPELGGADASPRDATGGEGSAAAGGGTDSVDPGDSGTSVPSEQGPPTTDAPSHRSASEDSVDSATDNAPSRSSTTDGTANEAAPPDSAPRGDSPDGSTADLDPADIDERLSELTAAVQQQNDLLKKQHRTIKQLIEELRERE